MGYSCKDPVEDIVEPPAEYINVADQVSFDYYRGTQVVDVETNISEIKVNVLSGSWCTASYEDGKLTLTAEVLYGNGSRQTEVMLVGGKQTKKLIVKQTARAMDTGDIKDDIKVLVKNAVASAQQSSNEGIEKTIDGDMSTIYHSPYNKSGFPISLTYYFDSGAQIDYFIYYPRTDSGNGNFENIEVWYTTGGQKTKFAEYDLGGLGYAVKIMFTNTLVNPESIEIIVKSGKENLASCAEMEFYQKSDGNFDYLTIFTDNTCSQLRPEITEVAINNISHDFFKKLATEIYTGNYEFEFRLQEYEAYMHPDIMAAALKTSTYGLRDNPTGIYSIEGEDLIVFVEDTKGQNISLFIQDPSDGIGGTSYALSTGMNKITPKLSGLVYILYYTKTGTEPAIKMNIATGGVNGYFDREKHKMSEWAELLKKASFKHFDMKGKYATLTFETDAYRKYVTNGMELIERYDMLVSMQQDFMGLHKYNRIYRNRAHFQVVYRSFMYAGAYHTGYHADTQEILRVGNLLAGEGSWGPAHEMGHTHQTRPGLRWFNMTEVTNNIHSQYIQTEWTGKSRLLYDGHYNRAFANLLNKGIGHNEYAGDEEFFVKLVPFWQLYLYLTKAQGKEDFYKDIYEAIRNQKEVDTSSITDGYYQIEFVKIACDAAQLNLINYFKAWGFLRAVDITVTDSYNNTYRFKITQKQVDDAISYIESKDYAVPPHDFTRITDDNISDYK